MAYDLAKLFAKQWYCNVVKSGFHVGSPCAPNDPHDSEYWRCGYRWVAPPLTEADAVRVGIITEPEPKRFDLCDNGNSKPECTEIDPCEECWEDQNA